jgi:plastocyanin
MMKPGSKLLSVAVFRAMVIAGVAATASSAGPDVDVKIDNFSFGPLEVTVAPGTTVKWTNRDDIPHTVVSTETAFKSKVLDTDEAFSYKFEKTGTYSYFCSIHPKMTANVIVK